jgi:hypothetical protein
VPAQRRSDAGKCGRSQRPPTHVSNHTAEVANVVWSSATIRVFQPADATTPVLTLGPLIRFHKKTEIHRKTSRSREWLGGCEDNLTSQRCRPPISIFAAHRGLTQSFEARRWA